MTTTFLPVSYADREAFGPEEYLTQDEVDAIIEREEAEAVAHAAKHGKADPIHPSRRVKYDPDQPRDDHGRFGSGGGSDTPKQEAAALNAGKPLPTNSPLAMAIYARTGNGDYGPAEHALIVSAVQAAPANAPELYRGFPLSADAGWTPETSEAFTDKLVVGAELELKLGSWTSDPTVSREFAALDDYGNPVGGADGRAYTPTGNFVTPDQDRVVFTLSPGAQALNLEPNAAPDFKYQNEAATLGTFKVDDVGIENGVWSVHVTQIDSKEPPSETLSTDYTERLTSSIEGESEYGA